MEGAAAAAAEELSTCGNDDGFMAPTLIFFVRQKEKQKWKLFLFFEGIISGVRVLGEKGFC